MLGLRAFFVSSAVSGFLPWPASLFFPAEWVDLQRTAYCWAHDKPRCDPSPGDNCDCGIHTCTEPTTLLTYALRSGGEVAALVDTWGKIIICEYGCRAQHAEIVAVVIGVENVAEGIMQELTNKEIDWTAWQRRARYRPGLHEKKLALHNRNAEQAAEKWNLPLVTLDTAIEMLEVDHADWKEVKDHRTGKARGTHSYSGEELAS